MERKISPLSTCTGSHVFIQEREREKGLAESRRVQHGGVSPAGRVCVLVWRNGERDGKLREMVSVAGMASSLCPISYAFLISTPKHDLGKG
jgi:hypothetical protein